MESDNTTGHKTYNVLVFPHGSEISYEIVRALTNHKYFKVILATSDEALLNWSSEPALEQLPFVSDADFQEATRTLVSKRGISFVIPAHDDVALVLSEMELPDGCQVIGQDRSVNQIVRRKSATYMTLKGVVRVPRTFSSPDEVEYPAFVKPDRGQGSKNALLIKTPAAMSEFLLEHDPQSYIFSEYLPGEEFTIDCFSDNGDLLFAGPRTRERTVNGISSLSRTVETGPRREELLLMASDISMHLGMHGMWFFQAKADNEKVLRLLEVGPRVSGTMMVNRAKGINFVELALWQAMGKPIRLQPKPGQIVVRRTLEPHYQFDNDFDRLLVDFDDTLIVDGRLNVPLMTLIFMTKNERKPVILITKHQNRSLTATLHEFGISAIFDEILHLERMENKGNFIQKGDLLVDDSFAERSAATAAGGTGVSLDMIETYLTK